MEAILYIAGGIALLALAWFFISLASTVKTLQTVLKDTGASLNVVTQDITDIKNQVVPILSNVNDITIKANSIAAGVQAQMLSIHETIDDTLDVLRGTVDDVERLKDELVATVSGPVQLVRASADGAVGAIMTSLNFIKRIIGGKSGGRSTSNPRSTTPGSNGYVGNEPTGTTPPKRETGAF
jgi:uncharacterized protein YoxC